MQVASESSARAVLPDFPEAGLLAGHNRAAGASQHKPRVRNGTFRRGKAPGA
jgi:hypothetical protein